MQTSGVTYGFYAFFGQVKNLAHVCEFVWSLRTMAKTGLFALHDRSRYDAVTVNHTGGAGELQCIANAPRTRTAFDMP